MRIKRKALLYDIANMAYTIADTGEDNRHILHRVRDICEDGNIDRVNRVLALAYSKVLTVLLPVLIPNPQTEKRGNGDEVCSQHGEGEDFEIHLRKGRGFRFLLTKEREMNIKETVHEFMVCMVLADWLGVTLPEAADVWKFRAERCIEALKEIVVSLSYRQTCAFSRRVSPI